MKTGIRACLFILAVLLLVCGAAGCSGSSTDPRLAEGYVEATGVRVPESVVYLSSHGDTSTFQLSPTIVPENATNKKLVYYANPEALEYFTVDQSGFIVARKVMDAVESIPVRIYSSTNPDAYTIVSVVIENVEVQEISFSASELKLPYPCDAVQLNLLYSPYHAQDGRDVAFTSQNPDVVSVDSTGLITIKDLGTVTVIARGNTLSGKILEGRIQIVVAYAAGSYKLDVITDPPKYDQVIGESEIIEFKIIRLNELSDPEPTIQWYVAGKRVLSQAGKWDYEYRPEADSTHATFYVEAVITPKNEMPMTLRSRPISLYKPFSGFSLKTNEPSGTNYPYGQVLSFEPLLPNTDTYRWYLNEKGESGYGRYIGETLLSTQSGKFSFTPDVYGAFVLTAEGRSDDTVVATRTFEFNIIKYIIGDKVQIFPETDIEEKEPDSYDWYLHDYNPEAQSERVEDRISQGQYIATTNGNSILNYEGAAEGWYVISGRPTLNGKPVYIDVDGAAEEMQNFSQPFQVWNKEGVSTIDYLAVDGTPVGGEYRPVIKWNALGGANSFIIEVTSNNQIYLIDTGEQENDKRGIVFQDYSVILPLSIATLEQTFSVRVKQKGGVFCDKTTYKEKSISEKQYGFLTNLNFSINRYILDMREMGELLNYVAAYKPQELLQSRDQDSSTYKVNIFTKMVYRNINSELFPIIGTNPYQQNDYLSNIYNLVTAAVKAYCVINVMDISFEYKPIDGSVDILLTFTEQDYISQPPSGIEPYQFVRNYGEQSRQDDFEEFGVQTKDTINAVTADQLYCAISMGKRPTPVKGSVAESVFEEAKRILRDIISDDMTDFWKVLAINDYLGANVGSNKALIQYGSITPTPEDLYLFEGYRLEGAILGKNAVSQGFAKAFTLLCWIEGITARTVLGTRNGLPHSWNKVLLGQYWYNVDSYQSRLERADGAALSHAYFLRSDAYMAINGYKLYGGYVASAEDGNIADVPGTELISVEDELRQVLYSHAYSMSERYYSFGLEFSQTYETDKEYKDIVDAALGEMLESATNITISELLQVADRYFIIVFTSR